MPSKLATFGPLRYPMFPDLVGGLLIAVFLPCSIWYLVTDPREVPATTWNSAVGASLAVLFAVWIGRNFGRFPGIRGGNHLLAASFVAFAGVALFLLLTRTDYSTVLFFSGLVLTAAWLIALNIARERTRTIHVGLVPGGGITRLRQIPGVQWRVLSETRDDALALDAVAADLHSDVPADWERRLADYALAGVPVYHYKILIEALTGRVEVDHLAENSFGSLSPAPGYLKLRGVLDRIAAAVVLVLLGPLMALVAILIRQDSPGPAVFRQTRMGYRGVPFTVLKFRTMRVDADGGDGPEQSMTRKNDDRITRLGAILRRTRLDELPQVINILRGEMSWIGPRPEALPLSELYEREISFYRYRHIVPPGITGWAQVCQGHVTSVDDVREKLNYDFFYIKNVSFWIDIVVAVRTALTMVTGRGAV